MSKNALRYQYAVSLFALQRYFKISEQTNKIYYFM